MGSNHCMNYGTELSIPRFRYMVIIFSFSLLICCVLAGQVIDTNIAMNSKCCGLPRGSQEEGTSTNCMDYFETPHNKFQHSQNPKKLYIGGLFPLSGTSFSTNGNIDRQVACLALERINSMRFIPEYDLVMYYNDTQVRIIFICCRHFCQALFALACKSPGLILSTVSHFHRSVDLSFWGSSRTVFLWQWIPDYEGRFIEYF